ncbi:Lrp/AsnC family transcriptional regulator [Atopomonas sediminilitoris]|uniref:Lrp/AsnC family transcriptional regulator n=1 Tax=Atopomonas sediminilitoris TaxID=2919919 RepID=UPI001F4DF2C1|nr:Lrp/AsnC family transcriptional regulator [Atopomonas sediminilitoris]MCJ8170846.1 Lrp/AsnC family transcriptional regulator [Atopomonas sediminilitoris]
MTELQRQLLNRLQRGLPLVSDPWGELGRELNADPLALREQVSLWLEDGILTRFGPLFDVERIGGAFTLAAMAVPEERFEAVHQQLLELPEVAHNYRREHRLNMWFVLAVSDASTIEPTLAHIEAITGLRVFNFPKQREFHVQLYLPV